MVERRTPRLDIATSHIRIDRETFSESLPQFNEYPSVELQSLIYNLLDKYGPTYFAFLERRRLKTLAIRQRSPDKEVFEVGFEITRQHLTTLNNILTLLGQQKAIEKLQKAALADFRYKG